MISQVYGINSWSEYCDSVDQPEPESVRISTETQPQFNPEWQKCIDALLKVYSARLSSADDCEFLPCDDAILAALGWLVFFRKQLPAHPPTCILPEPGGGVIVEWHLQTSGPNEDIVELTFYGNGRAEHTVYTGGRIVHMKCMPFTPPQH
jgi:hypothetical protein